MNTNYQIHRISILPFGLVNAHLVTDGKKAILVDAGLPGSEGKVEKALRAHGLKFQDIKLIVVTHAHVDHAGSAAKIRSLSGAPIVAHQDEVPFLKREKSMSFCPTGWFGELFIRTNLMFQPYEGFEPDILLSKGQALNLKDFGFEGSVTPTPGHTGGSISVQLGGQDALVGDLIASGILLGGLMFTDQPKRPPFEENPEQVATELQKFTHAGIRHFYMGHGGPLKSEKVAEHIQNLRRLQKA